MQNTKIPLKGGENPADFGDFSGMIPKSTADRIPNTLMQTSQRNKTLALASRKFNSGSVGNSSQQTLLQMLSIFFIISEPYS